MEGWCPNAEDISLTCREDEGGSPRCKLGTIKQKVYTNKRLVKHVEIRGLTGTGEAPSKCKVMVIGSSPDWEEDHSGQPFTGSVGTKAKALVQKAGIKPEDVYYTYMAKCKPPKGRRPSAGEIKACGVHLKRELELVQPEHVVLLGTETLKLFRLHSLGGINAIHGKVFEKQCIFWEGEEAPTFKVLATWSPASLVHNYNPKLEQRIVDDFKVTLGHVSKVALNPLYKVYDTLEDVEELVKEIQQEQWFAFDTESTALGFHKEPMLCVSLSWKKVRNGPTPKCKNAIIPLFVHDDQPHEIEYDGKVYVPKDKKRGPGYFLKPAWSKSDLPRLKALLKLLFENPSISKAAHNIKYDINVIRQWLDIRIKGFLFDTMLMHHVLDELPPHALEALADLEFGTGDYSAPIRAITGHGQSLLRTYDHVPCPVLYPYASLDAECVYRLCEIFFARLQKKAHLWKLYCEETEPAIRTLAKAEWHGSLIDLNIVHALKDEYEEKQEDLLVQMRKIVPPKPDCPEFQFNPMSTQQVRDALIDLGFINKIEDKQAPSGYNTSKEVLAKLREQGVTLADLILKYRTNKKILSTYIQTVLNDVDEENYVRYSWMIHGTTSGRLACRFLHQIPQANKARKEAGKPNLRDVFIVRKGYKYVYFDYSQIELRVLALLANDENMLSMFANKQDIHIATSKCILTGLRCDPTSKFNRQLGKMFNFGLAYGSEGYQLVKNGEWEDYNGKRHPVDWSMVEMGRARFKELFPQLTEYLENTPDFARMNKGVLVTPLGRERRLGSKLNDRQEGIRKAAEREAVNFTIQSTAGGITVRTLNEIHRMVEKFIEQAFLQEDDILLINTVHDSGAYEVREDLVKWFTDSLKTIAERPFEELNNYSFPCDMGIGNSWSEAEAA